MIEAPLVILDSFNGDGRSWRFSGVVREVFASTLKDVVPALEKVEWFVANGYHAAGFISYEAAAGLDRRLVTAMHGEFPLLKFFIFRNRLAVPNPAAVDKTYDHSYTISGLSFSSSCPDYCTGVERIREYIAAGDTYQVNFTFRRRFNFSGSTLALYRDLCRSQRAPYCGYLDFDRYCILSVSPELFFRLKDDTLTTRPMKGTAKRGRWPAEDAENVRKFQGDEKERAENLMIVDLLRNDMGIVSKTGSVKVDSLFDVETLETIHQMTSTITSRVKVGTRLSEVFQALFPCGSVTGAPKKRTMEIIAELEDVPRGLYTGCIGYISPGPEAVFNVAIRTVVVDRLTGTGEIGLGSGITWDSDPLREYEECLAKGRFVQLRLPEFRLIETLLVEDGQYILLDRHLKRLRESARYFGFNIDLQYIQEVLQKRGASLKGPHKVRLLLSRNGMFSITDEAIPPASGNGTANIAYADKAVHSSDPFLYHKTENRGSYSFELAKRPDCADVVFVNERGEVTEGANNNIVALLNGELVTPPVACGLLPGTFREELLESGTIMERVMTRDELERAEEIYLINSVRRWRKVRLI